MKYKKFWDSLTEFMFPKDQEKERKMVQEILRYGKGKVEYWWDDDLINVTKKNKPKHSKLM